MATNELNENHERCLNAAVALFNNTKKMGSGEYSEKFLGKLNDDIAVGASSAIQGGEKKLQYQRAQLLFVVVGFASHPVQSVFYSQTGILVRAKTDSFECSQPSQCNSHDFLGGGGKLTEFQGLQISQCQIITIQMQIKYIFMRMYLLH